MVLTWRTATERALYGPDGFFVRPDDGPSSHFRTSVHASGQFATAIVRLLHEVDTALHHPDAVDLVDVAAGRGELLGQVLSLVENDPTDSSALRRRLHLTAVERAPRPAGLPAGITWQAELPVGSVGLVVANEWLDDVPLDVVQLDGARWRVVLVDPEDGSEQLGPPVDPADAQWLTTWWPTDQAQAGDRAEVGRPRDECWARVVGSLDRGLALAIDYAHARADRAARRWSTGTLVAYRHGRLVAPVPDGSCDLTAHVALDACAAAGRTAGATDTRLTTQRTALLALGLDAARPALARATTDPRGYLADLTRAGEVGELVERTGLGSFGWLLQAKDVDLPAALRPARPD